MSDSQSRATIAALEERIAALAGENRDLKRLLEITQPELSFGYTNYRGEHSYRRVRFLGVRWGATAWHPVPGRLLMALDLEKEQEREFAMADIDGMT